MDSKVADDKTLVLHRPTSCRVSNGYRYHRRITAILAVIFVCSIPSGALSQETLNIATWGGAYGRAQEVAVLQPYAKETGTAIAMEAYGGNPEKLRTLIKEGKTPVDVVDVSAGALKTLCDEGLLAPIDAQLLWADGKDKEDFLAGAVSKCGVASMAWAMAIVANKKAFSGGVPSDVGALLDTNRFPGKRALPNDALRTLELVLLADGVQPENIYQELATAEGADRAFAALDRIRDSILLWDNPAQSMAWVISGRAAMAAGYSGRIFRAAVLDRNLEILWDGQIYDLDAWAIPEASQNKAEAMRFIRFATAPAQLAAQARLTAYGPMRRSALAQVGEHPAIGVDMREYLPTAPENAQKALQFDQVWWDRNGEALNKRFAAWATNLRAPQAAKPEQPMSEGGNSDPAETDSP
ncbi:MAG: extracellular solute-binding protein [Pseudomonadota bacterium]